MTNKLLPVEGFLSDHELIKSLFRDHFIQLNDELKLSISEELAQVNEEHRADVERQLMKFKDEIKEMIPDQLPETLDCMKKDISWLKQRSSKATVRKRIALAVFIAVTLTAIMIVLLIWFGKI